MPTRFTFALARPTLSVARLLILSLPLLIGAGRANAQSPLPSTADAPVQPTPTQPQAIPTAISERDNTLVSTEAPSAAAKATEGCRILTDKAMAADLRAATAQAQKMDAAPLGKLVDESIGLWTLATERCDGRALERARRNLGDSQRTRQSLMTELGSGAECARGQKDANSLQELAQQAIRERRWLEAALLYRKAETSWDVASEKCQGEARRLAESRREQTTTDAHNAEFCAPLFERARESSQTLRRQSASLSGADRQMQSQVAETLWRDAQSQCQGPALDLAQKNAQALAKERGTPWVATTPTTTPMAGNGAAPPNPTATTAAVALVATSVNGAVANTQAVPNAVAMPFKTTVPTAASSSPPPGPTVAQDLDIEAGGQRYVGRFVRDGAMLSGSGRVSFSNGDVYVGELLNNQRHGQGEFGWANGQRYKGTWNLDTPQGNGTLTFANGNRYVGSVALGVPEGTGELTYATGDSFKGQFVKGRPQGPGEYRWANGQHYQGPWLNDQPNGQGVLVYTNGNRYEGTLVQGIPDGQGTLTHASGDVYEGQFVNGVSHGHGIYKWKQGDWYDGQWKAGLKHGQGAHTWANGDRWEGIFDNDQQSSTGTLTRKQP